MDLKEKRYAVPEAAEILGVAQKTLWTKIAKREIGVYRFGRCVRVGEHELQRFIEQGFTPARDAGGSAN